MVGLADKLNNVAKRLISKTMVTANDINEDLDLEGLYPEEAYISAIKLKLVRHGYVRLSNGGMADLERVRAIPSNIEKHQTTY